MARGNPVYNPITDSHSRIYYEPEPTPPEVIRAAAIADEVRAKKAEEQRKMDTKIRYYNDLSYVDDVNRIRDAKRQAELEEKNRLDQLLKEQEDSIKLAEKQRHITEAKKRYKQLSFFSKLFAKKIDYFKRGVGYYNPDGMTNEQIDNLYQGKSR